MHQVDFQTYLLRCEALEYERREKMRFFLGDPFPSGYSLESLYDCLELFLEIECSPFFSTSSFQNTKKILFLRDLFPQVKSNQLYQAVLSLQNIDENLYRVVKKRFGDHLDEVNPINQNEKAFLTKAMELLRQSLDDLGFKGVYKTFYDQFPGIDRMTVRKVLSWVRINSEKYYQIIIARHGISLLEWNRLTTKENTVYLSAIKRFKLLLNRYLCFAQAKVDFKNHKAFLQIIKDRRKGCSIKTLMIKYHLPLEVLFDILNQNLLLFSEELFLDVLYDFFAYHQEEKIINNFRYWMLVSSLHSSSLNHYKEQLVQRIDENLGNIYNIYRYLPQKK